jgi:hypothetical protein
MGQLTLPSSEDLKAPQRQMGKPTGDSAAQPILLYSDREGTVPFTQEVNEKYIDTDREQLPLFSEQKNNDERFLNSWEVIVKHTKEHIQPFPACSQIKEAQSQGAKRT